MKTALDVLYVWGHHCGGPVPIPIKRGGCRSSEDLFSQSVLQKGGTVAYTIQYINKTLHTSINRITVRFYKYDTNLHAA